MDWNDVLPADEADYVFGNPPFVGKKERTKDQRVDLEIVFGDRIAIGVLDYVTCWYRKAVDYIRGFAVEAAFVSTNSITLGEQPPVMWPALACPETAIRFAHRTFAWTSEARGSAHVHCVIIGFGLGDSARKCTIYDYAGYSWRTRRQASKDHQCVFGGCS